MQTQPVMKSGRAAVFAAVCVGLSAAAHQAMSSMPIPGWYLASALLAAFYFARAAAGRERGLVAITAMMLGAQAVLHLWFAVGQYSVPTSSGCPPMPNISSMSSMSGMGEVMGATGGCPTQPAAMGHEGTGMLLAHVVAALVCAWWLRRGEAAVFALGRRVSARASGFLRRAVGHGLLPCPLGRSAIRERRGGPPIASPAGTVLRFQVIRRGPPSPGVAG